MTEKPDVDFPDGPPPTDLEITDITVGDGAEATPGSQVRVHYVGVSHSSGEEFDASYNRGAPLDFPLGAGRVIQGWDQGVAGMKVGGRRRLVIPPQGDRIRMLAHPRLDARIPVQPHRHRDLERRA